LARNTAGEVPKYSSQYGFPSNENELSSKFQYDIIWPTITLTSIYLQLAFTLIGRAAETLHEGLREISMEKYEQKEKLSENLLNV